MEAGRRARRWDVWRPTVSLCRQPTLHIDRLDMLNQAKFDIDRMTFEDANGLPLFQSPGLMAHTDRITGVTYIQICTRKGTR